MRSCWFLAALVAVASGCELTAEDPPAGEFMVGDLPAPGTFTECCVLQSGQPVATINVVLQLDDLRVLIHHVDPPGSLSFVVGGAPLAPGERQGLGEAKEVSLDVFFEDCGITEATLTFIVALEDSDAKIRTQRSFTIRNDCGVLNPGMPIDALCDCATSVKIEIGDLASGDNYQGWTFGADGTCSERVTNNASRDRQFRFSPDGTEVSYASNRQGAQEDDYEIYVAKGTIDNVRRLTHANDSGLSAREHAWSPDGTRIVYAAGDDLFAIPAAGGVAAQLTSGAADEGSPTFSQDSTRIAFVRDNDLWIMDADGSDAALVLEDVYVAAWSPVAADGRRIAVQRPTGFFVLEDDGSLTPWGGPLAPPLSDAIAWSPDGQRIATHAGTGEMWIREQADSTMVPLGPNAAAMVTEGLSWRLTGP